MSRIETKSSNNGNSEDNNDIDNDNNKVLIFYMAQIQGSFSKGTDKQITPSEGLF